MIVEKFKLPGEKKFAFTILDDTDNATVANVQPVYDFLSGLGLKTTKSLWIYPPRDNFFGTETTNDEGYLNFLYQLENQGFELCLHSVGSGEFNSSEINAGFEKFKELFGYYPKIHANHSKNPDNIYFSPKQRFTFPLNWVLHLFQLLSNRGAKYSGEKEDSDFFWGNIHKRHIKYTRSRTYNHIVTSEVDRYMPYRKKSLMEYSNFWFSSSDGHTIKEFNDLTCKENVDRLVKSGGICIIYTHFAEGFCVEGKLDKTFQKNLEYLASFDGYFEPVSNVLDLFPPKDIKWRQELIMDFFWFKDRLVKKLKYGR